MDHIMDHKKVVLIIVGLVLMIAGTIPIYLCILPSLGNSVFACRFNTQVFSILVLVIGLLVMIFGLKSYVKVKKRK